MSTHTSKLENQQTTKDRILDAAELVFAEKGLDGSSLRDITKAANVNVASVSYHFGSKAGLIEAVFTRHLEPMNTSRIDMLDLVEARAVGKDLSIEAVLDAFIRPVVMHHLAEPGLNDAFMRIMSRCLNEPPTHLEHVKHLFDRLMDRFHVAFSRALPEHSPSEIFWGLHFTIGIIHHALQILSQLHHLPHCPSEAVDANAVAERLIKYTSAGMQSQHVCDVSIDGPQNNTSIDL